MFTSPVRLPPLAAHAASSLLSVFTVTTGSAEEPQNFGIYTKTCELFLLFGCLWITLAIQNPGAAQWAGGAINAVLLTAMGFAVDAAMPEAFMQAVGQHLEHKQAQFAWSLTVAIAMIVLIIINFISAAIANGDHTSIPASLIITLLIVRCVVGISYVTIRECQEYLGRRAVEQQ